MFSKSEGGGSAVGERSRRVKHDFWGGEICILEKITVLARGNQLLRPSTSHAFFNHALEALVKRYPCLEVCVFFSPTDLYMVGK